jgi:hypothetical protein
VETNENNCVVALKTNQKAKYGIIEKIFKHSQVSPQNSISSNTWLVVRPLLPVPAGEEILKGLVGADYKTGLSLRRIDQSNCPAVFHVDEILAHCAWMEYKVDDLTAAGAKVTDLSQHYVAVVCLER